MKALVRRVELHRQALRDTARATCSTSHASELLRSAEQLQLMQEALRDQIAHVDDMTAAWRSRAPRRRSRLKTFRRRFGSSPLIGEHLAVCRLYEESLAHERRILRQAADAIAWQILRADPRVIAPLYATRTHGQPKGAGLHGPLELQKAAHATGLFLVLDNDLTRCLGQGDLTIVPANGPWLVPLVLELATDDVPLVIGAQMTVNMSGHVSDHPLVMGLYAEFARALGLQEGTSRSGTRPQKARQESEMSERAKISYRYATRRLPEIPTVDTSWRALDDVILTALQEGSAAVVSEPGVAFLAARRLIGDDPEEALRRQLEFIAGSGFDGNGKHLTSEDFATADWMSALAPPVALWPISVAARVAILSTDVFYACATSPTLWDDACQAVGLRLERRDGWWAIHGPAETVLLSALEVRKSEIGVVFSGISPRAVAKGIASLAE